MTGEPEMPWDVVFKGTALVATAAFVILTGMGFVGVRQQRREDARVYWSDRNRWER